MTDAPAETPRPGLFYGEAVGVDNLVEALAVEGVDEEIGVLRLRLRALVHERPEEVRLMLKGFELIVRAVAARYRMSPKSREQLADALADAIDRIGGQMRVRFDDV